MSLTDYCGAAEQYQYQYYVPTAWEITVVEDRVLLETITIARQARERHPCSLLVHRVGRPSVGRGLVKCVCGVTQYTIHNLGAYAVASSPGLRSK